MATAPRITTWSSGPVIAVDSFFSAGQKLEIPFKADRVTIKIFASSGNPNLYLSFDMTTVAATMHHSAPANEYTFMLQEIDTIYYSQSGTDCHFIVNAETKAWPSIF